MKDQHIKIARTHFLLMMFYAIWALCFFISTTEYGYIILPSIFTFLGFRVCLFLSITLTLFSIMHFVVYKGAKARKPWARMASIFIGCFFLFGFPISTAIGLYMLIIARNRPDIVERKESAIKIPVIYPPTK